LQKGEELGTGGRARKGVGAKADFICRAHEKERTKYTLAKIRVTSFQGKKKKAPRSITQKVGIVSWKVPTGEA